MKSHVLLGLLLFCALLASPPPLALAQSATDTQWLRQLDDPRSLGRKLLAEGNLIEAKEVLERAELQYPGDLQILRGLAETYYGLGSKSLDDGQAIEAVYYFERALEKDRSFPETWTGLGRARFLEGDYNAAIDALTQAEALGAKGARELMVRVRVTRASRAIDMSRLPDAEQDLQQALQRLPDDAEVQLTLGRLRYMQERAAEAIEPLKKAALAQPFYLPATLFLAFAEEAQKNWLLAIAAANSVATAPEYREQADGVRARSYYNWGLEAYGAEAWPSAEQRFLTAATFATDWPDPRFGAGLARIKQQNGDGAVALLEPIYGKHPDHPGINEALATAKHLVGRSLWQAGRLPEAAETLNQAFKLDPGQVEILMTLGAVEEARGRFTEALDVYFVAVRSAGVLEARRAAMRLLDEKLAKPLQALEQAELILQKLPDDSDAKTRAAAITGREGLSAHSRQDYEAAAKLLGRHVQLTSPSDDVRFALATAYARTLAFRLALDYSQDLFQANAAVPAYADLHYDVLVGLGDEASLTRQWNEAKARYGAALQIKAERHVVRARLGGALLELQDYPQATAELRTVWDAAAGLRPQIARPLAMALTGWGGKVLASDAAKTVALSSEAIDRDGEYPEAYLVRSRGYERQNNLDLALPDAEAYHERREDDLDGEAWLVTLLRRGLDEAYKGGRFDVAEARARRLLQLRDADPDGIYWLARSLYAQNRWADAQPFFAKAAAVGPYRAQAYVYLARGNHGTGAYEDAAKFYLAARRLDRYAAPVTEQITTFRAAAKQAQIAARLPAVAQYYSYAYLLAPTDPDIAYEYGLALLAIDRAKDAIPHLRRANVAWPDRRDVAFDFATALTGTAQPLLAVKVLLKWEAPGQPNHQEARIAIGRAFLQATYDAQKAAKLQDAAKYALQAADRLANEPEPWYALGVIRFELGANAESLAALRRAYEAKPNHKDVVKYLANVHARLGFAALTARNLTGAKKEFADSLLFMETLDGLYGSLLCAEAEKDADEMLQLIARIESKQADYKDILHKRATATRILGEAAFARGDYDGALKQFRAMLTIKPDAYEAHYYIGAVAYNQKRFDDAVKELELAAGKVGYKYENLLAMLTKSYGAQIQQMMSAQQFDPAMKLIEKSLSLDGNQPEVLIWQGSIYEQREKWSQARQAYQKALAQPNLKAQWRTVINTLLANLPQVK